MHKKICTLVIVLTAVLFLLAGCKGDETEYPFEQPDSSISSIEVVQVFDYRDILKEQYDAITVGAIISESEQRQFLSEFRQIPCFRYWNDPADIIEGVVLRINYKNGDFELIGSLCGYYCVNSQAENHQARFKSYYFDEDAFMKVIERYCDYEKHITDTQ